MSETFHIPGIPKSPEPSNLVKIASSIHHPDIAKVGLTTTEKGDWALLVGVKPGVKIPLKDIEEKCSDFPIIYQEDNGRLPIARPAYPEFGE